MSNELVCTTGAEPASWVDDDGAGAAAAAVVTAGFGAGLAACFGSALGATRTTDCGLASATFGLAGAAAAGAGAVVLLASAVPPIPTLRAKLEKKPSDLSEVDLSEADLSEADLSDAFAEATRVLADDAVDDVVATTGSSCWTARLGFGGLTVPGIVPGARASDIEASAWLSPPSERPVFPSGIFEAKIAFMPPSMPVLRRATGVPLDTSLAVSAASFCSFSCTALAISSGIT
ncbi:MULTISPECIES: pentapeptide repeat-containing protein [Bradyrhizobium]|uniref:pentapeptide repeat-containing protein n=1 Tax=Bradyrhizobium TaxID=374 RepID=UPI00114233D7